VVSKRNHRIASAFKVAPLNSFAHNFWFFYRETTVSPALSKLAIPGATWRSSGASVSQLKKSYTGYVRERERERDMERDYTAIVLIILTPNP
jgi:hypothetical protein